MTAALKETPRLPGVPPVGMLPPRMRLLYVATPRQTGRWLAEAFAADSATRVLLEEVSGGSAGLARLRDEVFDAVLLTHEPGELDALEFVEGLRAGGSLEPMVVLGRQSEQELATLCYEVGADGYVCVNTATTRMLLWVVARAMERHRLLRDSRRLAEAQRQRLHREHQEAQRLLDQQRRLIDDLESLRHGRLDGGAAPPTESLPRPKLDLPEQLVAHYRELLRAYVIMGSGNLGSEMSLLGDLLASAGVTARQAVQLHLEALQELLEGLGSRSTRHVMTRADLLVLEVVVHLAEGYRERYQSRVTPPRQQLLPGFDAAGAPSPPAEG